MLETSITRSRELLQNTLTRGIVVSHTGHPAGTWRKFFLQGFLVLLLVSMSATEWQGIVTVGFCGIVERPAE